MDRFTFRADYALEGNTLTGVAYVFGTRGVNGGVTHEFDPHAFDKSIAGGEVVAFYAHDVSKPLARPSLAILDGKLHVGLDLGHQSYAEDLRENMRLGLMNELSIGVRQHKYETRRTKDGIVRYHHEADMFDISTVVKGGMPDTQAVLHSAHIGLSDRERRIRALARAGGLHA